MRYALWSIPMTLCMRMKGIKTKGIVYSGGRMFADKLTIGDRCSFSGVSIWCHKEITLGNNVRVGANCTIMDSDQHTDDPRAGKNKTVVIEDNVWLGGYFNTKRCDHRQEFADRCRQCCGEEHPRECDCCRQPMQGNQTVGRRKN